MSIGIYLLKFQKIIKPPSSKSSSQQTALLLGLLDTEDGDITILLKCCCYLPADRA